MVPLFKSVTSKTRVDRIVYRHEIDIYKNGYVVLYKV